MNLEHTEALLLNIKALAKTRKMTEDEFVKLFADNDELFNVVWRAYKELRLDDRFFIARHLGYCPWCYCLRKPFNIEELAEVYELKTETIKKKLNQVYKRYNNLIDENLDNERWRYNA